MRNDRFTGQPRYFDRNCGPLSNGHHAKGLRQFAGQIELYNPDKYNYIIRYRKVKWLEAGKRRMGRRQAEARNITTEQYRHQGNKQ